MTIEDKVAGNHHAKRALELALKGKHSIKFIGNGEARVFADYAKKQGLRSFAFQPCPCGNYEHPLKACLCSPKQIRDTKKRIAGTPTDLTIQTTRPKGEEAVKLLKKWYPKLGEQSWQLLGQAYSHMKLEFDELATVLKVAETITKVGHNSKIEPQHIAEALQYQPRNYK